MGEDKPKPSPFVLPTKGHCFICLKRKKLPENTSEEGCPPPPAEPETMSLQRLSHYLKINFGKIVTSLVPVEPGQIPMVFKAEVRAELCTSCASATEKFAKLYEKIELIQMEMDFTLHGITKKMLKADLDQYIDKVVQEQNEMDSQIVQRFREEALKKCCFKLESSVPKVKLERLTVTIQPLETMEPVPVPIPIKMHSLVQNRAPLNGPKRFQKKTISGTTGGVVNEINSQSQPNLLTCPHCKRLFLNKSYLEKHMKFVHPNKTLNMPGSSSGKTPILQQQDLSSRNILFLGKSSSGPNKPGGKPIRRFATVNNNKQRSQARTQFRQPLFKANASIMKPGAHRRCQICTKTFTSNWGLKIHMESIHYQNKAFCDKCNKSFTHYSGLKRHRRLVCPFWRNSDENETAADVGEEPPSSSTPGPSPPLQFRSQGQSDFKENKRLGNPQQSIPPRFRRKTDGSQDLIKIGEKFKCNLCPQLFTKPQLVRDHLRCSHFGERFSCGLCPTFTMTRSAMRMHKIKRHGQTIGFGHLDPVPVSQPQHHKQPQKFSQGGLKNYHKQKHLENRIPPNLVPPKARRRTPGNEDLIRIGNKFKCNMCPRLFLKPQLVRDHIKCYHFGERFFCGLCPSVATTRGSMRMHMRKRHGQTLGLSYLDPIPVSKSPHQQHRAKGVNSSSSKSTVINHRVNNESEETETPQDFLQSLGLIGSDPPSSSSNVPTPALSATPIQTPTTGNHSSLFRRQPVIPSLKRPTALVPSSSSSTVVNKPKSFARNGSSSTAVGDDGSYDCTSSATTGAGGPFCEICQKSFSTLRSLERHRDSVHRGIRYKCQLCQSLFMYSSSLSKHLKTFHNNCNNSNPVNMDPLGEAQPVNSIFDETEYQEETEFYQMEMQDEESYEENQGLSSIEQEQSNFPQQSYFEGNMEEGYDEAQHQNPMEAVDDFVKSEEQVKLEVGEDFNPGDFLNCQLYS